MLKKVIENAAWTWVIAVVSLCICIYSNLLMIRENQARIEKIVRFEAEQSISRSEVEQWVCAVRDIASDAGVVIPSLQVQSSPFASEF